MIVTAVKGRRMVILNRWSGQAPRGEVIVLAEIKGMKCSGHYFRYLCFLWVHLMLSRSIWSTVGSLIR